MANETVSFDYSLYQANCSFSDVEEAIKNITTSNEKQFDSIKKEKSQEGTYISKKYCVFAL